MKNLLGSISYVILTSLVLFNNANAACSGTLINNPGEVLADRTVCVTAGEKSQEFHQGPLTGGSNTGGTLADYKKGASDPIDPTKVIGSWSSDAETVTYTYPLKDGSTVSYTYNLYLVQTIPTQFMYCNGTGSVVDIPIDKLVIGLAECN